MAIGDVGAVASLVETVFKWVTEPEGYHELSLGRKLEKLHGASLRALAEKDWMAVDALLAEYRRLSAQIT